MSVRFIPERAKHLASIATHIGSFDSRREAEEAWHKVKASAEYVAFKDMISEKYGGNHGGYRTGERRT